MSKPVHMAMSEGPRRFEVFTGEGRRRRFSAVEKAAIVAESYVDGVSVCSVARRHGLLSSQLFTWRLEARSRLNTTPEPPLFVPAIVAPIAEAPRTTDRFSRPVRQRRSRREHRAGGRGRRSAGGPECGCRCDRGGHRRA
ncbi:transposase [Lichenifustis flavocetrariae]|uniref:transposase n=1 Tax=Lichenifustis flavocetrariae TaxID=2949735 RepID=UPI003D0DF7A2